MNWKNVLLASVAFALISFVIHLMESFLTIAYYLDPAYFSLWSKIMMPGNGPPGLEFFVLSLVFAFINGLIFSLVYIRVKRVIAGENFVQKGLNYGSLLFVLTTIPFTLTLYLLLNLPLLLILSWALSALLVFLLGGLVIAKLVVD